MIDDRMRNGKAAAEGHLSEDQLEEVLMELAQPAVLEHAARCTLCAARLELFRESIDAFNQATLAWSEARSKSLPAIAAAESRGWLAGRMPQGWNARQGLTYAGAALAGVVILFAGVIHGRGTVPVRGEAATPAPSDYFSSRQQEISNDNAMLSAISAELYQPVAIPEALSEEQAQGRRTDTPLKQVRD